MSDEVDRTPEGEDIRRRKAETAEAIDLFADLIGRVALNHEFLNGEIREVLKDAFEIAGIPFEQDVADRLRRRSSAGSQNLCWHPT